MIDLVQSIADLDSAPELHLARILILLNAFSDENGDSQIEGLTKLAKLDFLLRYPTMLEKALLAKNCSIKDMELESHERYSVESQMVRYRFGPWDHRYRAFLNTLVSIGFVKLAIEGRKVIIILTDKGKIKAAELTNESIFTQYVKRSAILKRHFDITATHLMQFIYETFPDILSLQSNKRIGI